MEAGGGGGAGAGIGGNGGKGGSSNAVCTGQENLGHSNSEDGWKDWGEDGYQGEDCGIININDSVTVYAYGGSGSKTVPSKNSGTNSGGSGYPAAGIGRWPELGGGGGDWENGAGGYVGTWGDDGDIYREEGHNGISILRQDYDDTRISGISDRTYRGLGSDAASYFTNGVMCLNLFSYNKEHYIDPCVGGQGGYMRDNGGYKNLEYCTGGSGGKAGNGGTITVGKDTKIYAFNGDRITNGDYESPIYDYDINGNKLNSTCKVLKKINNTNIVPTKIFAQGGILRNVYYCNVGWNNKPTASYEYFKKLFAEYNYQIEENVKDINPPIDLDSVSNNLIRKSLTIEQTGYTNPMTGDCYGIGSGAGYIEVSNGTYTVE